MQKSSSFLHNSRSGFTLLEMVLAVGILALVVGGVMASIRACIESSDVIRRERIHQQQCDALQSLLLQDFITMPADTVLRYSQTDTLGNQPIPLRLRSRQPSLAFINPTATGAIYESIIAWKRQNDGSFTLGTGIAVNDTPTFHPSNTLFTESFSWTPLLRGIKSARLRFYDSSLNQWVDTWEKEDVRPDLAELSMEFVDSSAPFRTVFWIPSPRVEVPPLVIKPVTAAL